MPKFKVLASQYVEQVCEVEVEACDAEDARDFAIREKLASAGWTDGNHTMKPEVYAVLDAAGSEVW